MNCPLCQFDNPPRTAFCEQCGRAQVVACSQCGTELPAAAKFCLECGAPQDAEPGNRARGTEDDVDGRGSPASFGPRVPVPGSRLPSSYTPRHLAERILTSRSAVEGERKQVTVLFVDVKGSVELAEQIDPERWHEIMDRLFSILAEGVHGYEGTINQYTGDGIMALFGAPLAHEDHAERACFAALHLSEDLRRFAAELRRSEGINFSVRMGINSGEVIVGRIGDDLRMDYTAQGHTVSLAARMQQIASADQVYLTAATAALVDGFFQLRDLGGFRVKGVRDPVRVHALEGRGPLRTRLDAARARGFSRFVGRAAEMALLEGALQEALAGRGQIVALSAPPGVGKSRLFHEFAETCRSRGISVRHGHCVPHGRAIPFLYVLEMIRELFGIGARDSAAAARSKVAGGLLLLDASLVETLPLLLDFLGIPDPEHPVPTMDPEVRHERLLQIVRRLVRARSRREPGVLIVEDLHWIDPGSERFLEALAAEAVRTRTLLLVNFRPTYQAEWTKRPDVRRIDLVPLGAEDSDALLRDLLGDGADVRPLAELIRERTDGNPFFIEEVVRSLYDARVLTRDGDAVRLETPVTEIHIPPSVQTVLEARIDRLTEGEKAVLQIAAVIGPEFAERVLLHVAAEENGNPEDVAERLRSLADADFIARQPRQGEVTYAFRHPLTQEAAYRSQLSGRRTQVHGAVARAVESLYARGLDERAALLAHHWERAGDPLQAGRWSRRAANWVRQSNLAEAMHYRRKVRELLRDLDESAETTEILLETYLQLLELGWRLGISAEDAFQFFSEGEALATRSGNKRHEAMLVSAHSALRSHFGSAADFVEGCERAIQLADQTDDTGLQIATRARLVVALGSAGELRTALELSESAAAAPPANLRFGFEVLGYSPYIRMVVEQGRYLIDAGHLDRGEAQLARAAVLAQEHDDIEVLGHVHAQYATLARIRGDAAQALHHAQEALAIAEHLGSPFFRAGALIAFGHAHILATKWSEAAEAVSEALRIARDGRANVETEPLALAWLAAAQLGLGDVERAARSMDEAFEVSRRRATRLAECVASIGKARVLLRADPEREQENIGGMLSRALHLVESTGARSNEPFVHVERARLAGALADEENRRLELAAAHRLFLGMGATLRAERIAREL